MWTSQSAQRDTQRHGKVHTRNSVNCLSDVHELQLCEKEADNDQSQPEWPVISGCHIMKQSMFTFLWWCLNITLKCLWFFPRHAANITMAFCGVGVDGTQLSRLRRPPPPCTQTPIYSTHRQGRASSFWGRPCSSLTQILVQDYRASPFTHPRDAIYIWDLPGIAPMLLGTDFWVALYRYLTHVLFPTFRVSFLTSQVN